ncbi:hypothetical protein [Intrasporangium sp.]|uniref:hypothetical protein n=1 Tax=Intrasporangium sp. TaxID=1925024 RepID=UPI00293B475D|nr:hypothetical protein [Intrasporangium sp.]MDV3220962.1 hypothetical protein [Intrasporangium sp.]
MKESRTERAVIAGTAVLALALVVGGAWAWRREPDSFGWFAYAPLVEEPPSQLVFMGGGRAAACAAVAVGLFLLAGLFGFLLGRRQSRHDHSV